MKTTPNRMINREEQPRLLLRWTTHTHLRDLLPKPYSPSIRDVDVIIRYLIQLHPRRGEGRLALLLEKGYHLASRCVASLVVEILVERKAKNDILRLSYDNIRSARVLASADGYSTN